MSQNALRKWGIGLLGAAVNSGAGATAIVIVDPKNFDPFSGGMLNLLKVMVALALVGAGLYLKNHPVPVDDVP
jgi:hypothetical protein